MCCVLGEDGGWEESVGGGVLNALDLSAYMKLARR
jgi:hypothetical protein